MKNKIIIILFMTFIITGALFTSLNKEEISYTERRKLKSFPSQFNKDYFNDIDDYLSDHFIFRDLYLKIHSFSAIYLFNNQDIDGVYRDGDYLFMMDRVIDDKSVDNFVNKINIISNDYFADNNKYFMPIPLKNHYLVDNDLDYSYDELLSKLDKIDAELIDIKDDLSLESYYYSDLHWRQEYLDKVIDTFFEKTGLIHIKEDYTENSYTPFYGSYYAYYGGIAKYDNIIYLNSESFDDIKIYSLDKDGETSVYDKSALGSIDSYSVYLDGPSSYLKIENSNSITEQKLIIFGDSYASSLIPLLIPSFKQIEVVDLRYYNSSYLKELNLDSEATVLFIYGSQIINNSYSLR